MKNSQSLFASMATVLASILMTACSASVDGGTLNPIPDWGGQSTFAITDANGVWKSSCESEFGRGLITTLTLTNGNFSSKEETFRTTACLSGDVIKTETFTGGFTLKGESSSEPGSYNVEIAINLGNGVTQYIDDLIRIEGSEMFFGDKSSQTGTYPTQVDRNQKYTKQ